MQLKSVKLTMGIIFEIVTVLPEGAFAMKNQNKCLKHIYLNYWQSYWAEKGTKMTRRGHKISISKFPGQPCGFKVAKDKKHRKFGRFLEAYLNVGAPCRDNQTSYFVAPDAFSIKESNYWVARVP